MMHRKKPLMVRLSNHEHAEQIKLGRSTLREPQGERTIESQIF